MTSRPREDEVLVEYARLVNQFSVHDGLVVASHRVQETDAIITTDGAVPDASVDTVWD